MAKKKTAANGKKQSTSSPRKTPARQKRVPLNPPLPDGAARKPIEEEEEEEGKHLLYQQKRDKG